MEITRLSEILASEPGYRVKQAKKAVFEDLVSSWDEVTALPKALREKLSQECPLQIPAEVSVSQSKDSVKALLPMKDGALIETVLMRHEGGRNTVCVSCQVGCPMRCTFCATGMMGLSRSLTADEIVAQVLFFARYLKPEGARVGSIVFMGMGEPMLNYDNVMTAIRTMHDPDGLDIGARHFSISTSGLLEGIKKLSNEDLDVNLAISLHAPNDETRKKIMPVAQAFPLEKLFAAIDEYSSKHNRKVMYEYLMLDGINDSDENARELAALMKGRLHVVNLISYNPTGVYTGTPNAKIERFKKILESQGIEVSHRRKFGRDIKGACGQLATEKQNKLGE